MPTVSFQDVQTSGVEARHMSLSDAEGFALRKKSVVHEEIVYKGTNGERY